MDEMDPVQIELWLSSMTSTRRRNKLDDQNMWVLCILTCWVIWKARCKLSIEERMPNSDSIIQDILRAYEKIKANGNSQPRRVHQLNSRQ